MELRKEQTKPKVSRRKKITNIKAEINGKKVPQKIKKNNETKNWFFEEKNTIDKIVSKLIKKKTKRARLNKSKNEGKVTINITETQRLTRDYYELYANKMDNLEDMDKFLTMYNLPRPNQE